MDTNSLTHGVSERFQKLVETFERAESAVSQTDRQLSQYKCDLANATNELGKMAVPADTKEGEVFNVWVGSRLLCIKRLASQNSYEIYWRKGGRV